MPEAIPLLAPETRREPSDEVGGQRLGARDEIRTLLCQSGERILPAWGAASFNLSALCLNLVQLGSQGNKVGACLLLPLTQGLLHALARLLKFSVAPGIRRCRGGANQIISAFLWLPVPFQLQHTRRKVKYLPGGFFRDEKRQLLLLYLFGYAQPNIGFLSDPTHQICQRKACRAYGYRFPQLRNGLQVYRLRPACQDPYQAYDSGEENTHGLSERRLEC